MKSQAAMEYLAIIAITVAIILPITFLFFRYSSESNTKIIDSQINQIGKEIISTAATVYFSGEGSKIILDLNMPKDVYDIYIIDERELVFNVTNAYGDSEAVFFSSVNITSDSCIDEICKLTDIASFGSTKVLIISKGNEVTISRFSG